jgi:hypothetical protein
VKAWLSGVVTRWGIRRYDYRQAKHATVDRDAAEHLDRLAEGIDDVRPGPLY